MLGANRRGLGWCRLAIVAMLSLAAFGQEHPQVIRRAGHSAARQRRTPLARLRANSDLTAALTVPLRCALQHSETPDESMVSGRGRVRKNAVPRPFVQAKAIATREVLFQPAWQVAEPFVEEPPPALSASRAKSAPSRAPPSIL